MEIFFFCMACDENELFFNLTDAKPSLGFEIFCFVYVEATVFSLVLHARDGNIFSPYGL